MTGGRYVEKKSRKSFRLPLSLNLKKCIDFLKEGSMYSTYYILCDESDRQTGIHFHLFDICESENVC